MLKITAIYGMQDQERTFPPSVSQCEVSCRPTVSPCPRPRLTEYGFFIDFYKAEDTGYGEDMYTRRHLSTPRLDGRV